MNKILYWLRSPVVITVSQWGIATKAFLFPEIGAIVPLIRKGASLEKAR
ncbi:hypothetical protein [Coxiella endosymbiont of Ornithodoros amblus]|nr:hypothetical protein [Coxiella endosymbiont of Ornithodoros amblus]